MNELKKLHPTEKQPDPQFDQDAKANAFQFNQASVSSQIESFSKLTAAGPSKINSEHLLHAVNCGAPYQAKHAIISLTKFIDLASRGQLPDFVAPILCSATLNALKKLKGGVRPIAVGEVIRRLIAKCIARDANSKAADLFNTKQLRVAVRGGAEGIVHATRVSFEKLQKTKNSGILQIDFKNSFNSVKKKQSFGTSRKILT